MIYPCPKPPKGLKPGRVSRWNKSDGKHVEICRDSEEWLKQREAVGARAGWCCENCGEPAPLHDQEIQREEGVMSSILRAGQAAHINARKMGGGSRNDKTENLGWLCFMCHHLETIGKLKIKWELLISRRSSNTPAASTK